MLASQNGHIGALQALMRAGANMDKQLKVRISG